MQPAPTIAADTRYTLVDPLVFQQRPGRGQHQMVHARADSPHRIAEARGRRPRGEHRQVAGQRLAKAAFVAAATPVSAGQPFAGERRACRRCALWRCVRGCQERATAASELGRQRRLEQRQAASEALRPRCRESSGVFDSRQFRAQLPVKTPSSAASSPRYARSASTNAAAADAGASCRSSTFARGLLNSSPIGIAGKAQRVGVDRLGRHLVSLQVLRPRAIERLRPISRPGDDRSCGKIHDSRPQGDCSIRFRVAVSSLWRLGCPAAHVRSPIEEPCRVKAHTQPP